MVPATITILNGTRHNRYLLSFSALLFRQGSAFADDFNERPGFFLGSSCVVGLLPPPLLNVARKRSVDRQGFVGVDELRAGQGYQLVSRKQRTAAQHADNGNCP